VLTCADQSHLELPLARCLRLQEEHPKAAFALKEVAWTAS
jgi:hypothetical protein